MTASAAAVPLLLHVFPSFAVGGAQVRFVALANRFGARWRHAVVALDGQQESAARMAPEVPLQLVPPPFAREDAAPRRLMGIAGLLRRLRPSLLVTSNWGSIEWAIADRLTRRGPHLHTEDGFGRDESTAQIPRRVLARRLVLRRSDVVLPSNTLLRAARERWHLPEARLRYIPNGIDLRRFNPEGPRAVFDLPGDGPVIGTVAALRPEKNLARMLRGAAILLREGTPLRLLIVGDGPERTALEALAADLGIAASVHFAGAIADPAAAYRAMDLLCLSSDTEQMPFSILEAMASGLPVAATDVGDIRAMVAEENQPHLAPCDDAALAAALRPLLLDPALRARIGAANRRRGQQVYDEETMFAAYAALIDRMTAG